MTPFVCHGRVVAGAANGQFISCISKGRLLGEVVLYSLVVPVVYCLVWFCVWGGIALRQSRQAAELEILGLTLFNNSAHFMTDGNEYCYDVPQDDILAGEETVFINYLHGVTPVCKFNGDNPDSAVFNVLNAFSFPRAFRRGGGFGKGLSLLFMLACCVFYMTAAGSASLIVDKMASSGRKNIHLARRMFWLVTVGALTTALLTKGGAAALAAIQAGIVICGVPCAILLCYMLQSITLMCHQTADNQVGDYEFPNQNEFSMPVYGGVFNILEYAASLGKVNEASRDRGKSTVTKAQAIEFLKGVLVPFVTMWQVLSVAYPQNPRTNVYLVVCQALSYLALLCFWLAPHWWQDLESLIWTPLAIHGGILVIVRSAFRARYQIRSNAIADVITSTFFWPQVLSQMVLYHREVPLVDALVATTTGAAAEDACALKQRRKRSVSSADEAVASLEPADMSPPLELVNVDVDNISKPKAGETTEI